MPQALKASRLESRSFYPNRKLKMLNLSTKAQGWGHADVGAQRWELSRHSRNGDEITNLMRQSTNALKDITNYLSVDDQYIVLPPTTRQEI